MDYKIPQELLYTKDHEWVKKENGYVLIGITDFAQQSLGDIVYVDIDDSIIDSIIEKDEIFGDIEAVKTVSELFMPITGTILEINESIATEPELVNTETYTDAWLIKVKIDNDEDLKDLLTSEDYLKII